MAEGPGGARGAPILRAGDRIDQETAARLRELPPGSVIVDDDGDCAQQGPAGAWWWMGAERSATVEEVAAEAVWPVVVVWLPTKPEQLDPAYWSPGAAVSDETRASGVVVPPPAVSGPAVSGPVVTEPAVAEPAVAEPEQPPRPRRRMWGWILVACLVVGLVVGFVGATLVTRGDGALSPATPPAPTASPTSLDGP